VIANLQQDIRRTGREARPRPRCVGLHRARAGGPHQRLADSQNAVVGKVGKFVATQAGIARRAADKLLAMPHVEPARFQTWLRRGGCAMPAIHYELGGRDLEST